MWRFGTSGLCLAAILAVNALVGASASAALPEFSGPFPKLFTSNSGKSVLETVGGFKVECSADREFGEVASPAPKSINVIIRFTGCEMGGVPCYSAKAAPGTILTPTLSGGTLGYVTKTEVGLRINPGPEAEFLIAEFECGPLVHASVRGNFIGRIDPVNALVVPPGHFILRFRQKKGKQKIPTFFGEPTDIFRTNVNFGSPEETGLSSNDHITFAFKEAVEIKA